MQRRTFLTTLAAGATSAALPLRASAEIAMWPYTPGLINERLDAGETLFVDFFAPWCATCQAQRRMINRLTEENPEYEDKLTFIEVDWDTYGGSELTAALRIPRRSTLITIGPDRREIGRVIAMASERKIKGLLDDALVVASGTA